jgi:hypothetical protein
MKLAKWRGGGGGERDGADRSSQREQRCGSRERGVCPAGEEILHYQTAWRFQEHRLYLRASDRHPIVELCPSSKAIHPKGGDLRNAKFTADRLVHPTVD